MVDIRIGSDVQIVEGLKRRDPSVLAYLYERDRHIVSRVVYSIVGNGGVSNGGDVEEIVQEVFLRVWTRAHLIDATCGVLKPWLLATARNLAIDSLRMASRRNRHCRRIGYEFATARSAYDPTLSEQLRRALAELPAQQRSLIEFAYFDGLSQAEISERTRKPLGTVKTRMRTALRTLRKNFVVKQDFSGPQLI